MVRNSESELGSLFSKMFLPPKGQAPPATKGKPVPKPLVSRVKDTCVKEDEETDVPRDDALSSTSGEVSLPVAEKAPTPRPPRQPPRRLHGSVKDLIGSRTPNEPPAVPAGPPMRLKVPAGLDAWQSRKRKAPEPPAGPPEVWERVIDTQRNAVYFYEHRTRRSSWDTPPQLLGWWERLREQTGLEFFWNSVSQNTVWHLPLQEGTQTQTGSLALGPPTPALALPAPDFDKDRGSPWLEDALDPKDEMAER
ncbi:unnamed protein product [Durusdinium trenchii]|uniref:WW domain-containing protein n=1 Tax=Durusdinium trenchii TaxID=1381693 RepID=A0ABP0QWK5_9DINO